MKGITAATEKTWYIIQKANGVIAHGFIEYGQNAHTPDEDEFESFTTEEDYNIRLIEITEIE
jgi:hypothetical protein